MYKFIDKEYPVLRTPLIRTEIIRRMDEAGYIDGVISLELSDLVNNDFENFLDLVTEKLIGSVCLSDINYKIVGCGAGDCSDEILLMVSGQADEFEEAIEINSSPIEIELPEEFSFKNTYNHFSSDITHQAKKINEHGDYLVEWNSGDIKEKKARVYYTENETKYFVNTGEWVLII